MDDMFVSVETLKKHRQAPIPVAGFWADLIHRDVLLYVRGLVRWISRYLRFGHRGSVARSAEVRQPQRHLSAGLGNLGNVSKLKSWKHKQSEVGTGTCWNLMFCKAFQVRTLFQVMHQRVKLKFRTKTYDMKSERRQFCCTTRFWFAGTHWWLDYIHHQFHDAVKCVQRPIICNDENARMRRIHRAANYLRWNWMSKVCQTAINPWNLLNWIQNSQSQHVGAVGKHPSLWPLALWWDLALQGSRPISFPRCFRCESLWSHGLAKAGQLELPAGPGDVILMCTELDWTTSILHQT